MTDPRPPKHLLRPTLQTRVEDLLEALQDMDADTVRALVGPDIEWRNTGLPTVRGSRRVERVLTAVSHFVTSYEVTEILTMTTTGDTVSSRRTETIRIGWLSLHLDVDGHYTFERDRLKIWDDRFKYRHLIRGVKLGRRRRPDPAHDLVRTASPMPPTGKIDCGGCGRTSDGDAELGAGTATGTPTGWSLEPDENYCPDCADTRFQTWGYLSTSTSPLDTDRVPSGPESSSEAIPNIVVTQGESDQTPILDSSDSTSWTAQYRDPKPSTRYSR